MTKSPWETGGPAGMTSQDCGRQCQEQFSLRMLQNFWVDFRRIFYLLVSTPFSSFQEQGRRTSFGGWLPSALRHVTKWHWPCSQPQAQALAMLSPCTSTALITERGLGGHGLALQDKQSSLSPSGRSLRRFSYYLEPQRSCILVAKARTCLEAGLPRLGGVTYRWINHFSTAWGIATPSRTEVSVTCD